MKVSYLSIVGFIALFFSGISHAQMGGGGGGGGMGIGPSGSISSDTCDILGCSGNQHSVILPSHIPDGSLFARFDQYYKGAGRVPLQEITSNSNWAGRCATRSNPNTIVAGVGHFYFTPDVAAGNILKFNTFLGDTTQDNSLAYSYTPSQRQSSRDAGWSDLLVQSPSLTQSINGETIESRLGYVGNQLEITDQVNFRAYRQSSGELTLVLKNVCSFWNGCYAVLGNGSQIENGASNYICYFDKKI